MALPSLRISAPSDAASFPLVSTLKFSPRIPELDGLRGIAILLVLLRHSVFGVQTSSRGLAAFLAVGRLSWSGVDLFFVLSGFLIGGILLDARFSPNYFQTFYIRRAYRILPVYAVFTGLFLFRHIASAALPGMLGQVSPFTIPWYAYLSLTQNVWMVKFGWYGPPAMMATWSLAVEEQFYLTIPLLVRKLQSRTLWVCLVSMVLAAPLLREGIRQWLTNGDFACYVMMPCRADALCWGVLCAMLMRHGAAWNYLQSQKRRLIGLCFILLGGMAFMTWRGFDQMSPPMSVLGYSWVAAFYAVCLLLVVSRTARGISRALSNRALMSLGSIAYGTYLLHMPLLQPAPRLAAPRWPPAPAVAYLAGGLAGAAAAIGIAAVSWRFLEKPLVRRGHRYSYSEPRRRERIIPGSVPTQRPSMDFA